MSSDSSSPSAVLRGAAEVFVVDRAPERLENVFPLGEFWDKGIGIEMGQAPVKRYNDYLRDMIINGRARPSFIVSHRLPLSKAAEAYAHFVNRGVGKGKDYTKVVLKPALDRAA